MNRKPRRSSFGPTDEHELLDAMGTARRMGRTLAMCGRLTTRKKAMRWIASVTAVTAMFAAVAVSPAKAGCYRMGLSGYH
jgi:hypothetical protein